MTFEECKQLWKERCGPAELKLPNADMTALLASVRTEAKKFDRMIFWRDFRECLAALLVAGVFGFTAWSAMNEGAPSWPSWIAAALPLGVAAFLLGDRWLVRKRRPSAAASVTASLDASVAELRHQVWLLRSIVWWYLAPLALSVALIGAQVALYAPLPLGARLAVFIVLMVAVVVVEIPIWFLNRRVVQRDFMPRIRALEGLSHSFTAV